MTAHKKLLTVTLLLLLCLILFLNLGRFVDITDKPLKSDLIVSLGGDKGCRIEKALWLYKSGFSGSGKFIYTGVDAIGESYSPSLSRKAYLVNNGIPKQDIVHVDKPVILNTMGEVFFIKEYMLKHRLKSVIFVSHPQHSRRISALAKYVAEYDRAGISYIVVSCNPSWWNKEYYFMSRHALKVSLRETVKLFYNLLKYSTPLISHTKYCAKLRSGEWEEDMDRLCRLK